MIRIICSKCKNAYLKNEGENLVCPSCKAEFPITEENLLSGIQYYNEGDFAAANDCLMKYIVKSGADPRAIFYKVLCDGFNFDEDTTSINGVYEKLTEALSDITDKSFIQYLALANDEAEKLETLIAEKHIRLFEGADAEKIKNEVSVLIKLQDNAREFRKKLAELADKYNEQAEEKIGVNFSKCFLVKPVLATEVGALKFDRIAENISTHTVFTGILSTDIKNLEIYYRCIVMFFETNRQKYDFLLASAQKFTELAKLLEEGNYNAIKGVPTIGKKLEAAAYDFFQDHLRDHDDEQQNTETVYIIAPETVSIEEDVADVQADEQNVADTTEEVTEFEDVYSSSDAENAVEGTAEEQVEEETIADTNAEETEAEEDVIIEIPVSSEDVSEDITDDAESEPEVEEAEDTVIELNEVEIVSSENTEAVEDVEPETTEEIKETEEVEQTISETENTVEEAIPEQTDSSVDEIVEPTEGTDENDTSVTETNPAENLQVIDESDEADDTNDNVVDDKKFEAIPETTEEKSNDAKPEKSKRIKHKKSYAPFVAVILIVLAVAGLIAIKVVPDVLNAKNYEKAATLYGQKNYVEAAQIYGELGDYEDSETRKSICLYAYASTLETQKKYPEAAEVYASLGDYEDSTAKTNSCNYQAAVALMDSGEYVKAKAMFAALDGYADSTKLINECTYKEGVDLIAAKDYQNAIDIFTKLGTYSDSAQKILEAKYGFVNNNLDAKNETTLTYLNDLTKAKYKDSVDIRNKLLGTTNDLASSVSSCINYSTTDIKTNLAEVENSKKFYFHVTVNDEKLYNKKLSIKYRTSFGYEDGKEIVLTANENTYAFEYPSTPSKNYTIEFKVLDNSNSTLTTQKITIK